MTQHNLRRDFVLGTLSPQFAHPYTPTQIRRLTDDDLDLFMREIMWDCMVNTGIALAGAGAKRYLSDSTYDEIGGLIDGIQRCLDLAYEGGHEDVIHFLWGDGEQAPHHAYCLSNLCGTYEGNFLNLYSSHPDHPLNKD